MKSYIIKSILFLYLLHVATVSGRAKSSGEDAGGGGAQLSSSLGGSKNGFNFGLNGNVGGLSSLLSNIFSGGSGSGSGTAGSGVGAGGTSGGGGTFANGISSIEDNLEKGIEKVASGIPGANIQFDSNNGSVGGSVSANFDISSFLKGILESPIRFGRTVIRLVVKLIWNIITLQFKALKLPITIMNRLISIPRRIVVSIVSRILNAVLKINSLNAEIVSRIIGTAESTLGYIISRLANVQIYALQTTSNIIGFSRDRLLRTVNFGLKIGINISRRLINAVEGGIKFLDLDKIPNLPVIRNIISTVSDGVNFGSSVISNQFNEFLQFVNKIIYQNQDFFFPIFNRAFNIFFAIRDAIYTIVENGGLSGIGEIFENLQDLLSPLINTRWSITGGLNGAIKNFCSILQDVCKKYDANYSEEDECSEGPSEELGSDGNDSSSGIVLGGGDNGSSEFGGDTTSTAAYNE